ncbi:MULTISPECIES: hypothetical protein [unclassified Streptomyces]|uniref:hypothetical protein n=1 Tax=unclassified Streptomyces TaxID=2593676 RepID=UPI0035D6540F
MTDKPTHIIESDRYGWNSGRFRLAFGDENVRNSLRGLLNRYPNAEVTVRSIGELSDETHRFILGENNEPAPF